LQTQWGNFTVRNVANDGNCLFSSIAAFVGETQEKVRERLGAQSGAWGGDDHARKAAQEYGRPVYIIEFPQDRNDPHLHGYAAGTGDYIMEEIGVNYTIHDNAIVLHFHNRNGDNIDQNCRHFQALFRKNGN
jgi:hypothetical protein